MKSENLLRAWAGDNDIDSSADIAVLLAAYQHHIRAEAPCSKLDFLYAELSAETFKLRQVERASGVAEFRDFQECATRVQELLAAVIEELTPRLAAA